MVVSPQSNPQDFSSSRAFIWSGPFRCESSILFPCRVLRASAQGLGANYSRVGIIWNQ